MAKSSHCGRVVTEDSSVSEPSRAGHSLLSCYLVEALQVSNRRWLWPIVGIFVLEMSDQHSKLGAPVAEVVQLQDVVTHERHQVWYALTYDCWPASCTQTQSPVVCNSMTEYYSRVPTRNREQIRQDRKLTCRRFIHIFEQDTYKAKASPYSIAERRVPELIPVLGSQPAGDVKHKLGDRLPLLSARPAVTRTTLKTAATSFAAWWTEAQWVWTVCLRLLPKSVVTAIWTPGLSVSESSMLTTRLLKHR